MKVSVPNRVAHTYVQALNAPPARVFPLLCPVRECEWTRGWDPSFVLTRSGVAELDCVFITPNAPEDTIWILTRYEPERFELEMIMVTPRRTVGKLQVSLAEQDGGGTAATVTYTHTALGPEGDAFLERFTEEWYRGFMEDWEAELNHFLATGAKLPERQ